MRTVAPRGLNDPVFWNSSSFSDVGTPIRSPSVVDPHSGVRCRPGPRHETLGVAERGGRGDVHVPGQ